jgi:heptosyltransferase-2
MHLAAACGVPTLAIFGPTTRELGFFPYGAGHRVLEADLPCRPCGLHGGRDCPEGHFLCMRLVTTDIVWKNAVEMLAGVAA